jgi:hypothetical protein
MKGELLLEGDDGGDVRNRDGAPATADWARRDERRTGAADVR